MAVKIDRIIKLAPVPNLRADRSGNYIAKDVRRRRFRRRFSSAELNVTQAAKGILPLA
jgi:hypothetical protein